MLLEPTWTDIAPRLALTMLAGAVISLLRQTKRDGARTVPFVPCDFIYHQGDQAEATG
jgi:hypothetical protein